MHSYPEQKEGMKGLTRQQLKPNNRTSTVRFITKGALL